MTALTWDQVGARRFESGVDRGVLYLPNGNAVPWNGLVSISETTEREVKSYYLDGIKFLDRDIPGSYFSKLGCFTYPDELDTLLGTEQYVPGVFVHDQRSKLFRLSYRTQETDDTGTENHKIHIVYNVLAVPTSVALNSLSNSPEAALFEFQLSGTPPTMYGIRPTAHISLHTRQIDPGLLSTLEALLYGTSTDDPSLPGLVDLLALVDEVSA
jgi:hypothetical protein